jgi:hypothetical protein
MLSITSFSLARPAVDKRLLPANAAQSAVNAYCDTGKLQALLKPKRDGFAHFNPPVSLYRERENGGWRDWDTVVDVIRSPLDTTPATLIYTGDGRPKITFVGSSTVYDLGLPAPITAPTVEALTDASTGLLNNVERVISTTYSSGGPIYDGKGATDRYSLITFPAAVSVTSDGEYVTAFYCTTAVAFNVVDSGGDHSIDFDVWVILYRDSVEVNRAKVGRAHGEYYTPGLPVTTLSGELIDLPAAGTYAYTFKVEVKDGNNGMLCNASMDVEVRRSNRLRVYSTTNHELQVDARVRFADITATGVMPATLNGKIFTVAEIISPTVFEILAMSEGTYTSGGTWTQYWSSADVESRAYRYTYVATINDVDYEGPASEASEVVDAGQGQSVVVSDFAAFPGDWDSLPTKIRIYRFAATSSTTGQYQFVAEIDIGALTYTDLILGENLGESLPDPARDAPPETLQGIVELPNGGAAAFTGKTVWFAEPNYLHAWPETYARNAHEDIVAIGAFGSSIAVATKAQPYVLTGTDPSSMTMDKVELSQPCLSKAGCVDFGYAWTYPSPDGLVLITTGRAEVISLPLFTEYQWRAYNPASFKAARYDNLYVCFYEKTDGERGGFYFDPLDMAKGVGFLDFWADAIWTDPSDGSLYIARNNVISKFDDDVTELDMAWRSKEFATPAVTFTTARVEAAKYPVSFSVFCDGQEVSSAQVYSKQAFRIGKPHGSLWSFEVRGQHRIDGVFLAENMQELGSYPGGA